jgi:geranylgeranylglycerol-phosphate geranylgeranyltransferase
MFIAGSALSLMISPECAAIAVGASIILYYYAKTLKNAGFIGNLTIAALTGMAIIYGGLSVSGIENIMYVAVFAFMVNLGREIVKDIEDYEGDKAGGARTLVIKYGLSTASRLGSIPLIALMAITAIPYVTGLYNYYYIGIIAIVDLILAYCVIMLVKDHSIKTAERVKNILKAVILIGMVALYIGMY